MLLLKNLTNELKKAEKKASLGEVVADFAHEVRNPINNISTGLQVLRRTEGMSDDSMHAIDRMQSDCIRMNDLMESILSYSRQTSSEFKRIDLTQLLRRILSRFDRKIKRNGISASLICEIGNSFIHGDLRALDQVFTNILNNSIDSMQKPGGEIAITIDDMEENEKNLVVTIADTGTGIPEELTEKIFHPFTTGKEKGTGLGLAITKKIIDAHQRKNICGIIYKRDNLLNRIYESGAKSMSITVLIIDDEENARKNISTYLGQNGYEILEAGAIKEGKKILSRGEADIVVLDVNLPDGIGTDLLVEINNKEIRLPVIMITGYGDIEMAVEAMKNGAHDFLTKPITDLENLNSSIERAAEIIQMRRELSHLRQSQVRIDNFIVGSSDEMKSILVQAQKAANASVSVLITGETGSGKEVLAQFIHQNGPRNQKPFIAINCAAIQPTVLESELFGYEAGAFTGADKRKHGLMEVADEGILFLDEISSMPTDVQAKLLRAIEEKAFRRVGGTKLINVDVQVIAASNRDIKKMIKDGDFREDLYYRLKVVDLNLPTLKQRKKDIPELVGFFIKQFNLKMGMNVVDVSPDVLKALSAYNWPGNIRELSNTIERAMLFCDGEKIVLSDISSDITG